MGVTPSSNSKRWIVTLVAPLAWLVGCDSKEPIRVETVPKQPPGATQAVAPGGADAAKPAVAHDHDGDGKPDHDDDDHHDEGGGIAWTVPAGWQEVPVDPGGMRHATFRVSPQHPNVELTVIPLGPQETLSNLNRWLNQLDPSAKPVPQGEVGKYVTALDVNGTPAEIFDIAANQQRMLAAIVRQADRHWVFKLMGPADVVGAQKPAFETFIRSIRFGAAADPHAAQAVQITKWSAPEGWERDTTPPAEGAMVRRELSFKVGNGQADLAVTKLPAGATGSVEDNVNRWRGQVGLPPTTEVKPADIERVDGTRPWFLMDLTGPAGADGAPKRMLVAFADAGRDIWFVKLTGPADAVGQQKANFTAFLKSIEFGATP